METMNHIMKMVHLLLKDPIVMKILAKSKSGMILPQLVLKRKRKTQSGKISLQPIVRCGVKRTNMRNQKKLMKILIYKAFKVITILSKLF